MFRRTVQPVPPERALPRAPPTIYPVPKITALHYLCLFFHSSPCYCRRCLELAAAPLSAHEEATLFKPPSIGPLSRRTEAELRAQFDKGRRQALEYLAYHHEKAGTLFPRDAFTGSPQQAAILNVHLHEYFAARDRARTESPYAVHPNQYALLEAVGMELPVEGAPTVPHGFHKNLEESQLRRMAGLLQPNAYGLISAKAAKVGLLPPPATHQNPVMEAKDVSRYPESALTASTFVSDTLDVFLLHDVSSVVGPHELVERLVRENPTAHLFVTGVNPAEVLEGVSSFHPTSHRISYQPQDDTLHWMPTGSESEGYTQPLSVTRRWLQSSSIRASNGARYLVTLRDYRYGHCLWHIFPGAEAAETCRSFPTGTLIRVPLLFTGTFSAEWLNRDFVSKMLSFGERTPARDVSNYLAKANGLRASNGAFISARDCHIGRNLCLAFDPHRSQWAFVWRSGYLVACFFTLRWDAIFRTSPDIYELIDERHPALIVRPSEGGGWSTAPHGFTLLAMPNHPSPLDRVACVSALAAVFVLPKMVFGVGLTHLWGTDLLGAAQSVWDALDMSPARAALTGTIVALSAALPNTATAFLTDLAAHQYRQLWFPVQLRDLFARAVVEICGAPGYSFAPSGPGRGWLWQAGLWLTIGHEIFPVLGSHSFTLFGSHSVFLHAPMAALALHPAATLFWYAVVLTPVLAVAVNRQRRLALSLPPSAAAVPELLFPTPRSAATWAEDLVDPTPDDPRSPAARWVRCRAAMLLTICAAPVFATAHATEVTSLTVAHLLRRGQSRASAIAAATRWVCFAPEDAPPLRARLPHAARAAMSTAPPPPAHPIPARPVQPRIDLTVPRARGFVSPAGFEYRDWLIAVETAYDADPDHYPRLTRNACCFYTTVSALTGKSAHLWYSWHMAARNQLPGTLRGNIGEATPAQMIEFCTLAGFGYSVDGTMELSGPPRPSWPVLFMSLSRNADTTLHCSTRRETVDLKDMGPIAQVLSTIRLCSEDWFQHVVASAASVAVTRYVPSAWLSTLYPVGLPFGWDRAEWLLAIAASAYTRPMRASDRPAPPWDFAAFPIHTRPAGPPAAWPTPFTTARAGMSRPVKGLGVENDPSPLADRLLVPAPFKRPAPAVPESTAHVADPPASGTEIDDDDDASPTPGLATLSAAQMTNKTYRAAFGTKRAHRGVVDEDTRVRGPPAPPVVPHVVALQQRARSELTHQVLSLPEVPLVEDVFPAWQPDLARAVRLADDLKEHPELLGPAGSLDIARMLSAIADHHARRKEARPIKLTLLFGVAGCGKTTATKRILDRMNPDERRMTRIITHTAMLRADVKASMTESFPEMRGFCFATIANALAQPSTGTMVFDDAGKFWGGILDLVALTNPGVTHIVVNGDPAQGRSTIPIPGAMSKRLPTMAEECALFANHYATISHRVPRLVADTLGIHTTAEETGFITHTLERTEHPIITSSPRYVQVLEGGGCTAVTFMDVQGEEHVTPVELDITGLEGAITDAVAYVGLTRSRVGAFIHGEPVSDNGALVPPTGSAILNAILYDMRLAVSPDYRPDDGLARACFYEHLKRSMPRLPWFQAVGYAPHFHEWQLHTDAAVHTAVVDARAREAPYTDAVLSAQPPVDTHDPELAPADVESRERVSRGETTRQFLETAVVNPSKHVRGDGATMQLSIEKRIVRASREDNERRAREQPREDLITMFHTLVPDPPDWDHYGDLHIDSAPVEYAERRTRQDVLSKLAAHDPDRTGADVKLSLKAQTIKKVEKLGCAAVGGQLIHEYDIGQTLGDAPYFRFLEERLLPCFPDNIIFYNRASIPDHVAQMAPRMTLGRGFSGSDVTGWDAGCDASVLNFDCAVMKACNLPVTFIADYRERRLNTRSQLGPMQTMQNSGDRGTWCMNTIRRAVVSVITMRVEPAFSQYALTPVGRSYVARHIPDYRPPSPGYSELLDVNGDDIFLDVAKTATPLDDTHWVFKDLTGTSMEFSGMKFCADGRVTYSPFGLYYRCLIKEETATSDPVQWQAYADLFSLVDSSSPLASEIARFLLRHLPVEAVLDRTHPTLLDHVARIASDPSYRTWLHATNLRVPPPRRRLRN